MKPSYILAYPDGCPGSDPDYPDALLTFTDAGQAEKMCQLSNQRKELRPVHVGFPAIRKLVNTNPGIQVIAVVTEVGPETVQDGKKARQFHRAYFKRAAFLALE